MRSRAALIGRTGLFAFVTWGGVLNAINAWRSYKSGTPITWLDAILVTAAVLYLTADWGQRLFDAWRDLRRIRGAAKAVRS